MLPINKDNKRVTLQEEVTSAEPQQSNGGLIAAATSIENNPSENIQTQDLNFDLKAKKERSTKLRAAFKDNKTAEIQSLFLSDPNLINQQFMIPTDVNASPELNGMIPSFKNQVKGGLCHYALQRCNKHASSLLNILIQNQCNINAQDEFGRTPLHVAIATENRGNIQLLLNAMDIKSIVTQIKNGNNILHIAAMNDNFTAFQTVISHLEKKLTKDEITAFLAMENNAKKSCLECIYPQNDNLKNYNENVHSIIVQTLPYLPDQVSLSSLNHVLNIGILSYYSPVHGNLLHLAATKRNVCAFECFYSKLETPVKSEQDIEKVLNAISPDGLSLTHMACVESSILKFLTHGEFGVLHYTTLDAQSKGNETPIQYASKLAFETSELLKTSKHDIEIVSRLNNLNQSILDLLQSGMDRNKLHESYLEYIHDSITIQHPSAVNKNIAKFLSDNTFSTTKLVEYAHYLIKHNNDKRLFELLEIYPFLHDSYYSIINASQQIQIKHICKDGVIDKDVIEQLANNELISLFQNNRHDLAVALLQQFKSLTKMEYEHTLQNEHFAFSDLKEKENTPLSLFHYFIQTNNSLNYEMLNVLLDHHYKHHKGIIPNDAYGRNILHLAALSKQNAFISVILKKISTDEILSSLENGRNALHIAAMNSNTSAIKCIFDFLKKRGIPNLKEHLNIKDMAGNTFMDYLEKDNKRIPEKHVKIINEIKEFMKA